MPEQIELMYRVASDVYGIAIQLIAGLCFNRLCADFIGTKRGRWLVGWTYFAAAVFLYYVPVELGNFTAYSLAFMAAFAVLVWIDRRNIRLKVFLTVTFFVLRWIAFSLVGRLEMLWSDAFMELIYRSVGGDNPNLWKYYYAEFVASIFAQILLSAGILYALVRVIGTRFLYKHKDPETRELVFLLSPSVTGMMVYGLFRSYADAYERETSVSIYQAHMSIDLLWIVCYLVILAGIVSTIVLYQTLRRKQEEESAGRLLESQMRDMQSHIAEVERLYADVRRVKHDIRNHMEVINSLLAQGKGEDAREYSRTLSETVERFDFPAKTGNPVTDVIIHEKTRLAEGRGIAFSSEFHYPADSGINAFDISVILSNALDNAIEAAQTGGYVKISSYRKKNVYLITVENSFEGILPDGADGLPQTKKSDRSAHGFGMQNMRTVAAKYYGDIWLEQTEGSVVLSVMLPV